MSTSIIASKSNSINTLGGGHTCAFCDEPPWSEAGYICSDPPLCAVHFDLTVLVEFMQRHQEALTLENITRRLERAIGNGGQWALTPDNLSYLLPAYLEKLPSPLGRGVGGEGEKVEAIASNKKNRFPLAGNRSKP